MDPASGAGDLETARLVSARGSRSTGTGASRGSQEPFPGLPPETSPVAPSLELERRLARHCHQQPPRPQPEPCGTAGLPEAGHHALRHLLRLHGRRGGYLAHSLAIMTDGCPPAGGRGQHVGQPLLPVGLRQAAHQGHDLRLAPLSAGSALRPSCGQITSPGLRAPIVWSFPDGLVLARPSVPLG
ncbi:hypothetical protein KIL84_017175 [Mauremys mutica]|uniref:Uncharacterized protein n=1 Tax=Mauremys mutica TaxID=74926 RepID=A0A9D3X5M8_9SAUR|nr:hypothetical protein KIL84_017175 [Mauremys mutica]